MRCHICNVTYLNEDDFIEHLRQETKILAGIKSRLEDQQVLLLKSAREIISLDILFPDLLLEIGEGLEG